MIDYYARSIKLIKRRLIAGVAVESKVVLGATLETSDLVLGGKASKTGSERSRALLALKAEDVSGETSNMWGSHGGTRDGVGTAVVPG
jgi:hypothetical protein